MLLGDRVGRRLKLQDLNVFMAVVQARSMGKAAERLNTVQPAVSRSIRELEHTLGVRLLDRHRHGIEPTEYGSALLNCGLAVFDDLRQGVKAIESLADPSAGEVRVGCNATLAASFVTAVVDQLSRRYPRMVFQLIAMPTGSLHSALSERAVDFLVAAKSDRHKDQRLNFEFLFDETFVVAAGAMSTWSRRRKIELTELMNEPWTLSPPESQIGSIATEAFRASGLPYPRVTAVTISPEARMSLLATGRFLTIVPSHYLRFSNHQTEVRVLPVELPLAPVPIGIVTRKNRSLPQVAQIFIEQAREIAKRMHKRR